MVGRKYRCKIAIMSQSQCIDLRPGVTEPVVLMISRCEAEQGDLEFRQIDPGMDLGMDFEAEYKAAMELKKG
jgi:hypothetical protein